MHMHAGLPPTWPQICAPLCTCAGLSSSHSQSSGGPHSHNCTQRCVHAAGMDNITLYRLLWLQLQWAGKANSCPTQKHTIKLVKYCSFGFQLCHPAAAHGWGGSTSPATGAWNQMCGFWIMWFQQHKMETNKALVYNMCVLHHCRLRLQQNCPRSLPPATQTSTPLAAAARTPGMVGLSCSNIHF